MGSGREHRRRSFRVEPDDGSPVEVILTWKDGSSLGRIQDLSPLGMGIRLPAYLLQPPLRPVALTLSFELPGCEIPLWVSGTAAYRRFSEHGIHYGIWFDWSASPGAETQRAAVAAYVLRRKDEVPEGE